MQVANSSLDAIIILLILDTMGIHENGAPNVIPVMYMDFLQGN